MDEEIWILGGTGRTGRAIAAELVARDLRPVLVGRDEARLRQAAEQTGAAGVRQAGSVAAMAEAIRRGRPAVVINTVGPFATTAAPIAGAALPHGHYLDLANDPAAVQAVLDLDDDATAAGRTLLTGAGFGVTATESVVVRLCQDRPNPVRVRVDMLPSLEIEAGPLGESLAATMLDGLPGLPGGGRYQGRRYRNGRLAPAPIGGEPMTFTLPDGTEATAALLPLGELTAAQRASGAPDVVSASGEAPHGALVRVAMPLAGALLSIGPVRAFAKRRLAAVRLKPRPRPRPYSWGHARLEWADGTVRDGWLRVGDASAYTAAVPAEATRRLLAGEGRPGAWTPAALFGPTLATACGATYLTPDNTPL